MGDNNSDNFGDFDDAAFRVAQSSFARGKAPGALPRYTASHHRLPHDRQGLPAWAESSHVGRLYNGRQVPRVSPGATEGQRRLVDRVRDQLKNILVRFRG